MGGGFRGRFDKFLEGVLVGLRTWGDEYSLGMRRRYSPIRSILEYLANQIDDVGGDRF